MFKIYYLAFAASLLLFSCKTANKAFEKGNYEDAVELAVKKIQKDPGNADMKSLVQKAYTHAVNQHEANIRNLSNSTSDNRYERIYNEYKQLQSLHDNIIKSPEARAVVSPTDYSSFIATYRDKTAEVYFQKGMALMDRGDKASFRQAYKEFQSAYRFKNNDPEIKRKMDEAYNAAVVKVLVVSNDTYGGMYNNGMYNNGGLYNNGMYGGTGYNSMNNSFAIRNFNEDLVRNLKYQGNNSFVQFFNERDVRGNVQPDEILELRLNNVNVGRSFDDTYSRNVSKQIVTREIVYRPDSIVRQYATVHARINVTRRTFISEADLLVSSRDARGKYLWGDVIRSEHRWQTEFATYSGDQRALSPGDISMINNTGNNYNNQVRQDNIMEELLRQLQNEATHRFRNYYNRYY